MRNLTLPHVTGLRWGLVVGLMLLVLMLTLFFPALAGEESRANIEAGRRLLAAGRWQAAESAFRRLAAGNREERRAGLRGLGEIYLRQRRIDELFALTEEAVREFAGEPDALAAHAAAWALKAQRSHNLMHKMRQAGQALQWADRAIARQPGQPLAHFVRALVNYHMPAFLSRNRLVVEDLEAVRLSRNPIREHFLPDVYWFLALTHRKLRQTDQAIACLKEAEARWPQLAAFRQKRLEWEKE